MDDVRAPWLRAGSRLVALRNAEVSTVVSDDRGAETLRSTSEGWLFIALGLVCSACGVILGAVA
jgi:hypothetical protein